MAPGLKPFIEGQRKLALGSELLRDCNNTTHGVIEGELVRECLCRSTVTRRTEFIREVSERDMDRPSGNKFLADCIGNKVRGT